MAKKRQIDPDKKIFYDISLTLEEFASHSTLMEYNFKGIPLGRQGKRRDWVSQDPPRKGVTSKWAF